jgi:hypothetical protein
VGDFEVSRGGKEEHASRILVSYLRDTPTSPPPPSLDDS